MIGPRQISKLVIYVPKTRFHHDLVYANNFLNLPNNDDEMIIYVAYNICCYLQMLM